MQFKIKSFFSVIWCAIMRFFSSVGKFIKKHKILSGLIALCLTATIILVFVLPQNGGEENANTSEVTVGRQTISQNISGSSVVEANDEYSVTALVSGEIVRADFEEGDTITKDQLLYEIDSSDTENSIRNSELSIEKA